MKVLVTVSEVADVDDEFEIDGLEIESRYLTYDLNEWDNYAVEEAVQLAEDHDDVEVVTATIGPERTEETIRQALAKGADRAIRIWDDALADASVLDPITKAKVLAAVVEDEEPDLVLTGVQTDDDAFGATGVALASMVDYAWGAVVNQLDYTPGDETANVHRELEGGIEELGAVDIPAVLTIQTGINEPRYASLRGIRQAQSKPLDAHTLDEIGVDAADLPFSLTLTDLEEPEVESDVEIFEGSADETAGQLAELLRDRGVGA
ncbi:MAG: electron transfer flavoprotein subunit beta/FixA family protein [Salinirussus sp.]